MVVLAQNLAHADAVFVADAAIVPDAVAVLTLMGAPTRRDEPRGIEPELRRHRAEIVRIEAPATIEGGDVLCGQRGGRGRCSDVASGNTGANAPAAASAPLVTSRGVLAMDGWTPTRGADATENGKPGQGGGAINGAIGGAGGDCGGCGGFAGKGSGAGGASVAVLAHESAITLTASTLDTKPGGAGGAAGGGGTGLEGGITGPASALAERAATEAQAATETRAAPTRAASRSVCSTTVSPRGQRGDEHPRRRRRRARQGRQVPRQRRPPAWPTRSKTARSSEPPPDAMASRVMARLSAAARRHPLLDNVDSVAHGVRPI